MITALSSLVLAAVLGEPEAEPEEDTSPVSVVVLPPDASSLPEERRALVLETVYGQLPGGRIELVDESATNKALSGLQENCGAAASCRGEVAERSDAQFILRAQVTEPRSSDYAIVLELYEAGVDEPITRTEDMCTICSEADLERIVRERSLDVREALVRHLSPKEEGTTPDPIIEHVVVTKPVVSPPTVRTEVQPPSRLRLAGWSLVGAGAAGTVGGIVLLALQGSRAGCPPDPRGGPCIPLVYRTVVPGAITAAIGVAALGTGVGLVILGKRRDANKASARLVPTGSGLAIAGRF